MEQVRIFGDFLRLLRRSTDLLHDDPLREEIYSVERLEQYAGYLASELAVTSQPDKGRPLSPGLDDSHRQLLDVYLTLSAAIRAKQSVSPAAELFIDNFHIVEEQVRQIRRDLPRTYYRELPKLAGGELQGLPRVYAVALGIIAHTDSRLDVESLRRYLAAFQGVSALTMGELWAVAITLRLALVNQLRLLTARLANALQQRARANTLAEQLFAAAADGHSTSENLIQLVAAQLDRPAKFDRALIVQLIQRLRDHDPAFVPVFTWLDLQLATHNTNSPELTQLDQNRMAATQVTVGNIISSMRLIETVDWRDFVESICLVDVEFAKDPSGIYPTMDFATRNSYRHRVEYLARRSCLTELDIARATVAAAASAQLGDDARSHIGYYLTGGGRFQFRRKIGFRESLSDRVARQVAHYPTFFYLGPLAVVMVCLVAEVTRRLLSHDVHAVGVILFTLLAVIPASELAVCVVNYLLMLVVPPTPLPRIETRMGIPGNARTFVVVPTLLVDTDGVAEQVENLQVHYLANSDPTIYFALLSDFTDADVEVDPSDAALLSQARSAIAALNIRYPTEGVARFHLFHRRRLWNPGEGKWMGVERKRGKIQEFNRLLRGATDTSFLWPDLELHFLRSVSFVITLDSDTELPRGAARRLIGTILHPLNKPRLCPQTNRVLEGYGILQPRVSVSMASAGRTQFARVFSGLTGLDPYTPAVAEVYQDLFGEGSFTGKGLYVVDAFEQALAGRVPTNTLLSHDLFEGVFARSALVSDVEVFDDFPANYNVFLRRQHRWIRGDWQLFPWLLPWVPRAEGGWMRNQLPLISRWKILDNLRRSLLAPAILIWLLVIWILLSGPITFWTIMIVLIYAFPTLAQILYSLTHYQRGLSLLGYIRTECSAVSFQVGQILVNISFLVDQAYNQCDAIFRTLYRRLISHRMMLEWSTFAHQQQQPQHQVRGYREFLGASPFVAMATGAIILLLHPVALPIASPFLLAWLINPWLKERLRLPPPPRGGRSPRMRWKLFAFMPGGPGTSSRRS